MYISREKVGGGGAEVFVGEGKPKLGVVATPQQISQLAPQVFLFRLFLNSSPIFALLQLDLDRHAQKFSQYIKSIQMILNISRPNMPLLHVYTHPSPTISTKTKQPNRMFMLESTRYYNLVSYTYT